MTTVQVRSTILGDPATPYHQIDPLQLSRLLEQIEATAALSGALFFEDTLSDLNAVTGAANGDTGFVLQDPNSGVYRRIAGAWNKTSELPSGFKIDFGAFDRDLQSIRDAVVASAADPQVALEVATRVEAAGGVAENARSATEELVELVWSPQDIYKDGATGLYLSSLNPADGNLWQDVARTSPLSLPGQRVASARVIVNSSPVFAEQPNASDRPYLGRYPLGGRRNLLVNSALSDAVVGSPGTLPNSWGIAGGTGMTTEVSASGTDAEGIPYLDLRIQGTPGSNFVLNFCGTTDVPVEGGKTYTWSLKTARVAGSSANISNMNLQIGWRTVSGSLLRADVDSVQLKDETTYAVRSFTDPAPTGLASPVERMNAQIRITGTGAIDITLRLGGMQFEESSERTGWQKVTRSPGIPYGLDVTEANLPDIWYLWRSDSSDSLAVSLATGLGSQATVARALDVSQSIVGGQTINSGEYQLLGGVLSKTVALAVVSRGLSTGESGILEKWMKRQRGEVFSSSTQTPASGAVSLSDLGYSPSDGDIRDLVAEAALLSPSNEVIIPFNVAPWVQGGTWNIPAGMTVTWEPGARVAQNHTASPGVVLNEGCTLNRPYFTSTVYNQTTMVGLTRAANTSTHGLGRRQISVVGPDVRILDVQMLEFMAGAILCDQPRLKVTGLRAQHIRSIQGWGGAIDFKNGCTDFYVEVDRINDCDRAIEPEDGASFGTFVGKPGLIERVWSRWYDASDGVAEASFCIGAHSHIEPEYGICMGVHYENFTLVDCVDPILFSRANATDDKMPQSCTAKGIVIVNTDAFPASRQGTNPQVRIEGNNCEVEVSFVNERTSGIHSTLRGQITRGIGNSLKMCNTDGVAAIPWIAVSAQSESSRVEVSALAVVSQPSVPADASQSHLVDVDGPGTQVFIKTRNVQNRGYVRLSGTALGSQVVNPDFVMPDTNAPNAAVRFSNAIRCAIRGGRYVSAANLSQLARMTSGAQRNLVSGVVAETSGSFATLDAPNAINNLISGNSFGSATVTGSAGNIVTNNV